MKANYHSHTVRCKHASGTERQYVEKAIEAGISIWGFSDHTPYPFPDGYRSKIRMETEELESYVTTVLDLKREYQKDIEIRLGLEAEYYPHYFEALLKLTEAYPIEYFILGQHFVGNEPYGEFSGTKNESLEKVREYADLVIEGMKTGKFLYLAHPEVIHYTGKDQAGWEAQMRRICRCAKSLDIPLEVNFLGMHEKLQYPREDFWKIAGQEGCRAVFGIDAHTPEAVQWSKTVYESAAALLMRNGVKLEETLPLPAGTF